MTPSEAIAAGKCAWCCGEGEIFNIMDNRVNTCRFCKGVGTLEAMWEGIDALHGLSEADMRGWLENTGGFDDEEAL